MSEQQHPITLENVAQKAGVSLATASRVLNKSSGRTVGEQLRERVLVAARELGFRPNAHARALASGATATIGVITHNMSDPYFAAIARGATRVASDNGLLLLLASTFRDPERELAYVSALRAQRARAILLIGSGYEDQEYNRAMTAELAPYINAGGRVAMVSHHDLQFDAVVPDNRAGGAAMAEALYGLGHRDFAVLQGPLELTTVVHRFEGFMTALAGHGITVDVNNIANGAFTRDGGYQGTLDLLRRGLHASVIFCLNDVMAVGACAALRERGLTIPADVSVAGFDDIEMVRDVTPAISTVRLPLERIGARTMEMVLEESAPPRPRVETVPGEVILRESTSALTEES